MKKNTKLFVNLIFVLDLGSTPFKQKKQIRQNITENGGTVSYILTKTSDFVIVQDVKEGGVDSYKTRKAAQLKIPVLSEAFVSDCVEASHLLDTDSYCVGGFIRSDELKKGKIEVEGWIKPSKPPKVLKSNLANATVLLPKKYDSYSDNCPKYANHFQVVKYVILQGRKEVKNVGTSTQDYMCVLECHIAVSNFDVSGSQFRIVDQQGMVEDNNECGSQKQSYEYFFKSCDDALMAMQSLMEEKVSKQKMVVMQYLPSQKLGSLSLRRMLDEIGAASGMLHPEVAKLVYGIASVAFGEICKHLTPSAIAKLNPDQITKLVVLLIKMKESTERNERFPQLAELFTQFKKVLPFKPRAMRTYTFGNSSSRTLSTLQDLIQLLKDIMLVSETLPQMISILNAENDNHYQCTSSFYNMLKCSITYIDPQDHNYQSVYNLIYKSSNGSLPPGFKVRNIFSIHRDVEETQFTHSIAPKKLLFHASDPKNFTGILSRGLLMPLVVVSEHGGERSDVGLLGNGIYFADDIRKAVSYSKLNSESGSRLLLVNEVALGRCHDYNQHMSSLSCPPEGYDSVRGVGKDIDAESSFGLSEYVIYKVQQQKLRYLVEFTLEGDNYKTSESIPHILRMIDDDNPPSVDDTQVQLDDMEQMKLPQNNVKAGLVVTDKSGEKAVPLKEVHIRAKILDMVAEVVVMQAYANDSDKALEAKFVFPLDENAAVCGFEAFINNKHVVGKVKEKEIAHKEYKAAIDEGHGAYLMDQEKSDVFTVSVGNLPPAARVLIKITYVVENAVIPSVDGSSDSILFYIPGSVAPNVKRETLISGPVTQTAVDRVTANTSSVNNTSLMVSVEMPFDLRRIESPTHKIFVKKTATKACVRVAKNSLLGEEGFKLFVTVAEIHVPRMWVEEHPEDEESHACMLAFYPEFDAAPVTNYKAIILIDMSQSMKQKNGENLEVHAKKVALMILKKLPPDCLVNVIRFGSGYQELFLYEQPIANNMIRSKTEEFIQSCTATCGSSEAWRPLNLLETILKSSEKTQLCNVFLLSDGHLNEEHQLLEIARSLGASRRLSKARIFSFSFGSAANQRLLRSISFASGGTHEHFGSDSKTKWMEKIQNQLTKAQQPVLKDIRVEWKRYEDSEGTQQSESNLPMQAPEKVKSLFNASRLVVYGFVSHCTQAELFANICGKEIATVVACSQLSITKGKTLHRLSARAMIKDYEEGLLDVDPLIRDQLRVKRKPFIINLSCKHDVVSPYSSFVAIEEREKGEKTTNVEGPSVADLVSSVNVDVIPEIGWDEEALDEELPTMKRIAKRLEAAKSAHCVSVMTSNRLFEEAEKFASTLHDKEKAKAAIDIAQAMSRMQMEVKYPQVDENFVAYLEEIEADRELLEQVLNFMMNSDVSMWEIGDLSVAVRSKLDDLLTSKFDFFKSKQAVLEINAWADQFDLKRLKNKIKRFPVEVKLLEASTYLQDERLRSTKSNARSYELELGSMPSVPSSSVVTLHQKLRKKKKSYKSGNSAAYSLSKADEGHLQPVLEGSYKSREGTLMPVPVMASKALGNLTFCGNARQNRMQFSGYAGKSAPTFIPFSSGGFNSYTTPSPVSLSQCPTPPVTADHSDFFSQAPIPPSIRARGGTSRPPMVVSNSADPPPLVSLSPCPAPRVTEDHSDFFPQEPTPPPIPAQDDTPRPPMVQTSLSFKSAALRPLRQSSLLKRVTASPAVPHTGMSPPPPKHVGIPPSPSPHVGIPPPPPPRVGMPPPPPSHVIMPPLPLSYGGAPPSPTLLGGLPPPLPLVKMDLPAESKTASEEIYLEADAPPKLFGSATSHLFVKASGKSCGESYEAPSLAKKKVTTHLERMSREHIKQPRVSDIQNKSFLFGGTSTAAASSSLASHTEKPNLDVAKGIAETFVKERNSRESSSKQVTLSKRLATTETYDDYDLSEFECCDFDFYGVADEESIEEISEEEEEIEERESPSHLKGFEKTLALLDESTIEKIHQELLRNEVDEMDDSDIEDLIKSRPTDDDTDKDDPLYEVLVHLERILSTVGVKSLGKHVFDVTWTMALIALIILIVEEFMKRFPDIRKSRSRQVAVLREQLKKLDLECPSMYSRLELGNSWNSAALNLMDQLADFIEKENISFNNLL